MFVFVEGPDKSGKTTFIEKLSRILPVERVKLDRRPRDASPQEQQRIRDWYEATIAIYSQEQYKNHLIVFDRFHPSEMVYCFKRNYDVFDSSWFIEVLEKQIKQLPHVMVYMETDANKIYERLKIEEDDYIVQQDVTSILNRYQKYFDDKCTLNYIKLSGNNEADVNIKQLLEFMVKSNKKFID